MKKRYWYWGIFAIWIGFLAYSVIMGNIPHNFTEDEIKTIPDFYGGIIIGLFLSVVIMCFIPEKKN